MKKTLLLSFALLAAGPGSLEGQSVSVEDRAALPLVNQLLAGRSCETETIEYKEGASDILRNCAFVLAGLEFTVHDVGADAAVSVSRADLAGPHLVSVQSNCVEVYRWEEKTFAFVDRRTAEVHPPSFFPRSL